MRVRKLKLRGLLCVILFLLLMAEVSPSSGEITNLVELTEAEKNFISEHPEIRIGYDIGFVPFEFKDKDGQYKGICADYVALLNERLGINLVPVEVGSWDETIERAKNREIDVLPGVGMTATREKYFLFTEPYIAFQRALYTRNDNKSDITLEDLKDHVVAVQVNSSHHEFLSLNTDITPVYYDTAEEALLAVASSKAEVYVGNLTTTNHIVKELGISNVHVANTFEIGNGLSFAIRKDWPMLKGIVDKGLASISEEERIAIMNKWSGVEVKQDLSRIYMIFFQAALIVALVMAITIYWMRMLRKENNERLKAQVRLNRTVHQLENLYNASLALNSMLSLEEVLEMIVSKLAEVLEFDYATIQVSGEGSFEVIYASGFSEEEMPLGHVFSFDKHPLASHVLLSRKPFVIDDNQFHNPPYGLKESKIRSRLLLPLTFNDEVIGVLTVDHKQTNYFDKEHIKTGMAFSIQAALAIHNARMFEALREARDLAEEATRAKGAFLANMSHEIRTPMNAIIGLTNLTLKTELTDKQRNYLAKVDGASKNLLLIINDILDFSKIEAGKMRIEHARFDLNTVMNDLANVISIKAHEKELEIIFDIDPNLPRELMGDALRIGQILLNLTSNAIKFTSDGEISVRVQKAYEEENKIQLKFVVEDTGIGMTPEQENVLFKSFEQADVSTTRKYGGTGLGLTICKSLVELHGGEIGFETTYGEGSTFYFTAEFEKCETDEILLRKQMHVLSQYRILVVDDNENFLAVVESYLEKIGVDADFSSLPSEAEELYKVKQNSDRPYDLVLVDFNLGDVTGIELCNSMRALSDNRPKFVLATGYGREEILSQVNHHRLDGYMIKPITQSVLIDVLMNVLGNEITQEKERKSKPSENEEIPGLEEVRGSRILLVEDNEINQLVACDLLESEGFVVECVWNGLEALNRLSESCDVDLVLMDIQMPIMDGYEATKTIREQEETVCDIPIIAMTADAMDGVKEHVLDSGFSDYLTKPIIPSDLFETLINHLSKRSDKVDSNSYAIETKNNKSSFEGVNSMNALKHIDVEDGLMRVTGNFDLYHRILVKFYENHKDLVKKVEDTIAVGAYEECRMIVHTIKGVSGNIGAHTLRASAEQLEYAVRDKANESIPAAIDDFRISMNAVLRDIQEHVLEEYVETQESIENITKGDHLELKIELEKMLPSVLVGDVKRCKLGVDQLKLKKWPHEHSSDIEELIGALSKYKYEEAEDIAIRIMDKLTS